MTPSSGATFGSFGAFDAVPQEVEDFFANFLELEPQIHQDLSGNALLLAQ